MSSNVRIKNLTAEKLKAMWSSWVASMEAAKSAAADRGVCMPTISMFYGIISEELMANWQLAVSGQPPFKIEPLR